MIDAAAEPTAPSAGAEVLYTQALRELAKLDLPFLLAGTYALSAYTGVARATKDLDIVCKPTDYPRVLNLSGTSDTPSKSRTNAGSAKSSRMRTSSM